MNKSKTTINNWENGKTEIDLGNLKTLCSLYNVTIDDIFLPFQSTLSKLQNKVKLQNKQQTKGADADENCY